MKDSSGDAEMTPDCPAIGTLRNATLADVTAIHAMTQIAYAGYRDRIPYSSLWRETEADVAQELAAGIIILCEMEGKLVGSVRCQVRHEVEGASLSAEDPFVYVHRLAVLPGFQRRGIGRRLMQAVEAFAQDQGVGWVRLEYRVAQSENQQFYDRLGYQTGEVSRWFADGSPRAVWMFRQIP
ncbi:GNAT family N-acetyltransferase [Leptolyngbya ohadii]|uniref:GNAT family N-acetyltransferase n=1 Tax=Leptolyngbya ohadii TaxID=1962290 RepID=UPI000B5A10BF|nr:GNAT family N-acetyltransferase [Leptolyngbya ohadii]